MFDSTMYRELEKNGTFSLEALETTLNTMKQNAYHYLYKHQLNAVGYKRFDFYVKDLQKITELKHKSVNYPKQYIYNMQYSFISEAKRLAFKRSGLVGKELSAFDISKNDSLFANTFMVFIDGKFFDTAKVLPREDVTTILFTLQEKSNPLGIPESYFKDLIARNAKVTVYFIPNCAYGIYKTNLNVLQKYKNQLELDRFNIQNNLTTDTKYITFVNTYQFLFSSIIMDTTNSGSMLRFTNNLSNAYNNKVIHLNVFGFRNLYDQIDVPGANTYFSLPKMDMPVPKENMMIFRNVGGKKYFAHDLTLKQYYPNVYEVVGNTAKENLSIYVFYFNDTASQSDVVYENELASYQELYGRDSPFTNGTINAIAKNFTPLTFEYSIEDFEKSSYYDNHLKYKVETMKKWIQQNPEVLRTYLNEQIRSFSSYYIDTSKINLDSKYRINNHDELDDETQWITFPDPQVVFVLNHTRSDQYLRTRFFVDGLYYEPSYIFKDEFYEYYYLPLSKVTTQSIIEIERLPSIDYELQTVFTQLTQTREAKIRSDFNYTANDIFVVDRTNNEYVDRSMFDILIMSENGTEIPIPTTSMKELQGSFKLRLLSSSLLSKQLSIFVRESSFTEVMDIQTRDDLGRVFDYVSVERTEGKNVRLFKNGRLLPNTLYDIDLDKNFAGLDFITPLISKTIGDRYVLDFTPYVYKVVHQQTTIPTNGFIDLRGKLNKPFDLKWYDVYLNGRKLHKGNIDTITPTLIFIKGVKTQKNLFILEKDRDDEIFNLGDARSLTDKIWDADANFRNTFLNRTPMTDSESDIITELVDVYDLELMRFFVFAIKEITFLNPDEQPFTDYQVDRFPHIWNDNQAVMLNPDDAVDAQTHMFVFPEYDPYKDTTKIPYR